jgi:DNA-binding transcriptional MerR regulator
MFRSNHPVRQQKTNELKDRFANPRVAAERRFIDKTLDLDVTSYSNIVVEGSAVYQPYQFAELAGVTVRALHYYDRLGLLKPRRTNSGYRLYRAEDLERLEQIVALKFVGLPLKQIKFLLDRDKSGLLELLRKQRRVLEEKRRLLDFAINAIQNAAQSLQPGERADSALLKKIIEVLQMQNDSDWMMKY